MSNEKFIIDHEKYGDRGEFDSLEEAQAAMLACGPEMAGTVFSRREGKNGQQEILDESGQIVGEVVTVHVTPNTITQTKHTPGALRAADAIRAQLATTNVMLAQATLARIIDQETAAPELLEACKLVLLFHSGGPWDDDKRQAWANGLTTILGPAAGRDPTVVWANGDGTWDGAAPTNEATTKNLCNAIRAAIAKAEGR